MQATSERLEKLVEAALCRPTPDHIVNASFWVSHNYLCLASELQAFLAGRRSEERAAEALRRFEGMQS